MTEFDKVIRPGGVGKVVASVNTDHLKGVVSKSVTVTSNDPKNPQVNVTLKADVKVVVDVQPRESVYWDGKPSTFNPETVTIVANDGQPFDITSVKQVGGDAFQVKVEALPRVSKTAPGKPTPDAVATGSDSYKVTVTPPKSGTPGQRYNSAIDLTTTHPKAPTLSIRAMAVTRGDIEIQPERVFLMDPPQPGGKPFAQAVKLRKTDGKPFKIEGVETSGTDIQTDLKTLTEGREYELEVKYTGAKGTGTPIAGQVTVKTDDPAQSSIVILVNGRT